MQISPEQQKAMEEQKAQCPFCKIVKGEIPAKKVYENEKSLIILDINPGTDGHMLVVPKEHYPILPFMPPDEQKEFYVLVREAVKVAHEGMLVPAATVFIANGQAAGQNVNHFMVHVLPREQNDGLEKLEPKPSELNEQDIIQILEPLKHNIGLMMQRAAGKAGGAPAGGMQKKPTTEEDLIKLIESNPQLLEMVLKQPEEFKKVVLQHAQLKPLFEGKDVEKIVNTILEKHGKKEEEAKPDLAAIAGTITQPKEVEADFQELKPIVYITSEKAKRFHVETCPFAQQIPFEKRIKGDKDEMIAKDRKACGCTGLVKIEPGAPKRNKDKKKKGDKKKEEPKKEAPKKEEPKRDKPANLDDIAGLFG